MTRSQLFVFYEKLLELVSKFSPEFAVPALVKAIVQVAIYLNVSQTELIRQIKKEFKAKKGQI